MASNPVHTSVPIDQIDVDDTRYRISTGGPTGPLVASIERTGILSPPVLIPNAENRWSIVSGFKRIAALQMIGVNETVARVLERTTESLRCIEIAVLDNTAHRELNPVELGRVVLMLDGVCSDTESVCQTAEQLGVQVNPQIAQKLRVAAQMRPILRTALVNGKVALPVALQLDKMEDASAAEKITELIVRMGLGLNRQRELIEWLGAISRREGISLHALLMDDDVREIIDAPEMETKQISRKLRHYLRQRRYPEMVKVESHFSDTVKALRLGDGIRLEPPPHFEGTAYSLKIDFKNHQELISRYQRLDKTIRSTTMASLWDSFRRT